MAAGIINIILLIYFIVEIIKSKKKNASIKLKEIYEFKALIIQCCLGVVQAILYLPWLIYFVSQLNTMTTNGFWISESFFKNIVRILGFAYAGKLEMYIGFVFAIILLIYLIKICIKNKLKDNKPAIFALLTYVLVIFAAYIMKYFLHTQILYYRYIFVITGLLYFVIASILSKGNNKIIILFCSIILVISIFNNVKMIKENYNKNNQAPLKYIQENLQEGDVIVYQNIGVGSVVSVNFPNIKQYWYNPSNWKVEEAYKAFGPQMETHITNDFLDSDDFKGRVIIVSSGNNKLFNKYFDNENYKLIDSKKFQTVYEDYLYLVKIVEYCK